MAKSHELNLTSSVRDNKKGFLKYVNRKMRTRGKAGLILVEDSHLTNRDMDKAEIFNAYVYIQYTYIICILYPLGLGAQFLS